MVRSFSLEAAVKPTVDKTQVEREAEAVRDEFQSTATDLDFDANTGGVAGAGAAPGGGGIGTATTAAAGARAGSSIAGAGTTAAAGGGLLGGAKKALPVALAGATAFGIKQAVQRLAQASPYLAAQTNKLQLALDYFLRPVGKVLAKKIDPLADGMIKMASNFNEAYSSGSLSVAVGETFGPESQQGFFKDAGEFVRNGFNSIMKDVATTLHSRGGFTGILLDAAKMGAKNLNAFIDGLTGVNIGAKINALASDIATSWPGWPDLKNQWPGWSNIVTGVDLAEFVNPLNIADMIDIPEWMKDPSFDPGDFDPRETNTPTFGGVPGGGSGPDRSGSGRTGRGEFGNNDGGGGSDPVFGSPGEADDRADRIDDDGPAIGLDTGGTIRSGGMARVHSGERVLPEAQVSDRGEADLAGADEITRQLRQIHREIRRQNTDSGGRDDAIVDRLDRLLRKMDRGGSTPRASEDDVIAALAKLLDRGGGRNPLER